MQLFIFRQYLPFQKPIIILLNGSLEMLKALLIKINWEKKINFFWNFKLTQVWSLGLFQMWCVFFLLALRAVYGELVRKKALQRPWANHPGDDFFSCCSRKSSRKPSTPSIGSEETEKVSFYRESFGFPQFSPHTNFRTFRLSATAKAL